MATVPATVLSRIRKNQLANNPLARLQQWQVRANWAAGGGPTHQTGMQLLRCSFNFGALLFGDAMFVMGAGAINVPCLWTPMRTRTSVNRFTALQTFGTGGGAEFWLTPEQTGCSLLIVDWGGNQYSMVHLQPYNDTDFGTFSSWVLPRSWTHGREYRRTQLKGELTTVVNNTIAAGGGTVQRYILVQSTHARAVLRRMQVIGVPNGAQW